MSSGRRGGPSGAGRGGEGRHSFAGTALRNAGLVDEDIGMREARSGPNRARRGRSGPSELNAGNGAGSSQSHASSSRSNARDRANPMGNRPSRGSRGGGSSSSNGVVGGADRRPQSTPSKGGRVPGGGEGSSSSSRDAANSGRFQTGGTVDTLRRFLASRWNPQASFMNLNSMRTDPILLEKGLKPPGVAGAHKDVATVLWKLCSENYPEILTLSLGHNELSNTSSLATLPQFLPDLKNISLEGNNFKWTKDLASWTPSARKGARFKELHELILQNNPVHSNAVAASNEQDYRYEVIAKFPDLRMLDGKPVSSDETQIAKLPHAQRAAMIASNAVAELGAPRNFTVQNRPGFSDEGSGAITPTFLHKFFTAFDGERETLRHVYSQSSRFTLSYSVYPAQRAKAKGFLATMPNQKKLGDAWTSHNARNAMRQSKAGASRGIRTGAHEIIGLYRHLPKTTHPLTDPTKFVVDAWVIPNDVAGATTSSGSPPTTNKPDAMLFINVHGEFAEMPSRGLRSFDRTFLVAPATPDSPAARTGWPCVVISEQLTIRQYSGTDAWALDALPVGDAGVAATASAATGASSVPTSVPAAHTNPALASLPPHLQTQAPQPGLSEQQHILALQLAAQTLLTYPFAVQCLAQNDWDGNKAFVVFNNLKNSGQIPPEAFAGGVPPPT